MEKKPSVLPKVFSIIALVISGFALISVIALYAVAGFGPKSGGTATALTDEAVLAVSGMVFFTGATWIFAMVGAGLGIVMLVVDIAVKRTKIIWMPVTSVILGIASMIASIFVF
ncbi:MAG: hypothetical protein K6F28_10245 [Lachnospiraceae bacterium]|nr:hypothetical protein [Lachnospiraceae bacterium]